MDKQVYIVSAVRTPVGSFGGVLKEVPATKLGATVIKAAVEKAGIAPDMVDEVLMGCVLQANTGQAPARQAAKYAGLPDKVICTTINKVCASGMKAIAQGVQSILLGDADIVVAGGMESMSNVPFYVENMRWGNKYGSTSIIDGLQKDGLTDCYSNFAMGCAADATALDNKISREEQDAFATESYQRSQAAWQEGRFNDEVVPVTIASKKGEVIVDKDEEPWNEAFSVVGIVNTRKMNLDPAKVNVNGGAVSIGHPLGCSGARIVVSLLHILKQNSGKYGAAGICNGGGGASAMVIEAV